MQLQTRNAHMRGKTVLVNGTRYTVDGNLCVDVDEDNASDVQRLVGTGFTEDIIDHKGKGKIAGAPDVPQPSFNSAKEFVQLVDTQPAIAAKCRDDCQTFGDLQKLARTYGYNFSESQLEDARKAYLARKAGQAPKTLEPLHESKTAPKAPEAPAVDADGKVDTDTMSSPFGTYSRALLTSTAKKLGISEPDLLMAAFKHDEAQEAPSGILSEEVLLAGAATLLPSGALGAEAEPEAEPEASPDTVTTAEGEPAEGDAWPDPDTSMKMDYLGQMADAYDVDAKGLKKDDLIAAIMAAMYPPDA